MEGTGTARAVPPASTMSHLCVLILGHLTKVEVLCDQSTDSVSCAVNASDHAGKMPVLYWRREG
jgi:hypothetical protein